MLFFIILALTLFTLMAGAISITYYKKIWNPILLFISFFLIGVLLAASDMQAKYLEDATFWILIGEIFFVSSFFIMQVIFTSKKIRQSVSGNLMNLDFVNTLLKFNILMAIISFSWSVYTVMQVAPTFADIFFNSTYVRMQYLARSSGGLGLVGLFFSFNFFTTFCLYPVALLNNQKGAGRKLLLVLFIRLCNSLVTMSKEAFIIDIIILISSYVLIVKDRKEEFKFYKKYGTFLIFLVVILLITISFQRDYIAQGRYDTYMEVVIETSRKYLSDGIYSFGELLNLDVPLTYGNICFRPIFNILSYIGIGERISIIQDALGNVANIYTAFGNMYRDFSYFGIIFLSIFFGGFLGLIYNKNSQRLSTIVVDSIVLMVMFFGFYDLEIIQTIYLFVMLYAVLFDRIFEKKLYLQK